MTIELALLMLFEGNLYDDKGYVSAEGYKALETLEGVTLTRNIDAMEDDAKQASIPYSYQMPKDYIKNKLDYSRPTVESDKELNEKIETLKNAYRIMSDAFENEVRKNKRPQGEWIEDIENLLYRCSNCNASSNIRMFKSNLHFCPNCGADMRVKDELNNGLNERPQIFSCFNCKYDYKSAADEPCKYCEKHCEWQAKEAENECND